MYIAFENHPHTLWLLSRKGPRSPDTRLCQHWPKNEILPLSKFLQTKVFWLDNKATAHFYTTLGVAIYKNHVARPLHSFNKCRKSLQVWKVFSAEIWKMSECHFWADVMLRQSRLWASRASPAQKSQDLRVVCSKNVSGATFFVFWVT